MISSNFYNKRNLITQFLGGRVQHYPVKEASVTLEWYNYSLKVDETLYTIAAKIFGQNLEHMWTYIADNNPPRQPDDWNAGDIVRLPKVIIRDTDVIKPTYSNATTDTASI